MTKRDRVNQAAMITTQFRTRDGMAYGFKCEGTKLTLSISPEDTATGFEGWRIEASTRIPEQTTPHTIVASGTTREVTLREVGRLWATPNGQTELPFVDWEAIAVALASVRAL